MAIFELSKKLTTTTEFMDRSADTILQKAFLELKSFHISGLGTFVRPASRRMAKEIIWTDDKDRVISLLDFLLDYEEKSASEAEAIHAKIRVALRSSLRERKQYHIQGAGTIKQRAGGQISFFPEPAVLDRWYPQTAGQVSADAASAQPSRAKRIIVASFLVAFVLLVISGFFVNVNKQETSNGPKIIAGKEKPVEDTAAQKVLRMLDSLIATNEPEQAVKEDPDFLPEKAENKIIPMELIASRSAGGLDTATAKYHLIVAVFSNLEEAESFCAKNISYPESCQFLQNKTKDGNTLYRVSIFRTQGSKAARQRRAFYRNGDYPDCWVLPKLPN